MYTALLILNYMYVASSIVSITSTKKNTILIIHKIEKKVGIEYKQG